MDGWLTSTQGIKSFGRLPENARRYIRRLEELMGLKTYMVSVGAKRMDAIVLKNPFK